MFAWIDPRGAEDRPTYGLATDCCTELFYRIDPVGISLRTAKRNRYPPARKREYRSRKRGAGDGQELGLPGICVRLSQRCFVGRTRFIARRLFLSQRRFGRCGRWDRVRTWARLHDLASV